jgi:hypothetical protein
MSGTIFDPTTDPGWGGAPLYVSGNPQSTIPIAFDTGTPGPGGLSEATSGDSGTNWNSIAAALGQLSKGLNQTSAATGANQARPQGAQAGQAASGTSPYRGAPGLDALVQMLNRRREALMPQPVGMSAAVQRPPTQGLLGF